MRRFSLMIVAASLAAGCASKDEGAAAPTAADSAPQAGLSLDDLKGEWSSAWGKLSFKADGSAQVSINNCGFTILGPGELEPPKDPSTCKPNTAEGPLVIDGYTLKVGDPQKRQHLFEAYVDADGRLHAGISRAKVTKLDGKKGAVKLNRFDTLTIDAAGKCSLASEMKEGGPEPVPCRFESKGGVERLIYTAPSQFKKGETEEVGLVYLPREGLLVSAGLTFNTFERAPSQ